MARSPSDILRRFRPAVAPGPAGPAGVPADRAAEKEAELGVVFAALASDVAAARHEVDVARADASSRAQKAAEEASAILARARGDLDAVRAEAARPVLSALDAERTRIEAEARVEVERVGRVSEARIPDIVDQVVAAVWSTADLSTGASRGGRRHEAVG